MENISVTVLSWVWEMVLEELSSLECDSLGKDIGSDFCCDFTGIHRWVDSTGLLKVRHGF